MSVIGPRVKCKKCGANVTIRGDGKIPVHDAKGTTNTCIGSLDRPD